MNINKQHSPVEFLLGIDESLNNLGYKLKKLFPGLNLTQYEHYDSTPRLQPDLYKVTVWRYEQLKIQEDESYLTELRIKDIADNLNRHPNQFINQISLLDIDIIIERAERIIMMLDRCTLYVSEIDIIDESGIGLIVVSGIDNLIYVLNDLYNLLMIISEASKDRSSSDSELKFDFGTYLKPEVKKKLMPFLIDYYTCQRPKQYGYMLYALIELKLAPESIISNKTALYRALITTFGNFGERQSLTSAINRLSPREINDEDKRMIEVDKKRISDFMKK